MNATLKTKAQWQRATRRILRAGWLPHPDPQKNWDHLAAFDFIVRRTTPKAKILDAGGEIYSPLVDWLFFRDYRSLHVLNVSFKRDFRMGQIRYKRGDCTDSPYPTSYFDVVTSLSVIEHGVAVEAFLKESHRVLRPGGHLIISTDYWKHPIAAAGKRAHGAVIKIFIPGEIRTIVDRAHSIGFKTTGSIDYAVQEKAVRWNGMGLRYTFIVFALRKA